VKGIFKLAFLLLVNDRGKFAALLVGITFASFLMIQMTSMFAGVLDRASSTINNLGARIWVMDPAVNTAASSIPMPDYILDAVRSIKGVHYAVPLYSGASLVKLPDGTFQAVNVIGLDDDTLFGRPQLIEGRLEDIYAENAFIAVKDAEFSKLGRPKLGAVFELNDHQVTIVGIAKVVSSGLFGIPTLYTTYRRAIQYLPNLRYTTAFILVEPKSEAAIPSIQAEVARLGYQALTREQFIHKISDFYTYQTGMGINFLIMTAISFVVGLSISGQTFYTFILENLEKFGALKAIGARGSVLISMILFQAFFTCVVGYGLGVGLSSFLIGVAKLRLPDYASMILYRNLGIALLMVMVIAGISSYIGIRKVLRIEPFDIFRG
jgi:putative ABC transport system permease protein